MFIAIAENTSPGISRLTATPEMPGRNLNGLRLGG